MRPETSMNDLAAHQLSALFKELESRLAVAENAVAGLLDHQPAPPDGQAIDNCPELVHARSALGQARSTLETISLGVASAPGGWDRLHGENLDHRQLLAVTAILESIADGFFALDQDWRFTYVNRRAAEIVAMQPEEMLGRVIWEKWPQLLGTELERHYRQTMETGVPADFRIQGVVTGRWYQVRVNPAAIGITVYLVDITEQLQLEERLAYHARLLEYVHDAIIATGPDMRITAWNKAAEKLYGWQAQEVIGKLVAEIIPSEFGSEQRGEALRHLDEHGYYSAEVVQYTRAGQRIVVEGITIPLLDNEGKQIGFVAANRDVTKRVRAEAALQLSEETFSKAFRASPDGLAISQFNGAILEVNESMERILGYSREEMLGKTPLDLDIYLDPADRQKARQLVIEQGFLRDYELDIRARTGEVRHTLLSAESINIGGEACFLTICRDITERKRVEQALSASEERYRQLVSVMPAAMYTCDAAGVINIYNQRAAELWGRAPQLGDTDEKFCGSFRLYRPDGSPLPHTQTPMAVAVQSGQPARNEEVVIERPDGSTITVAVNIDPLFDESGRIVGAINVFQDISDLKHAEEALRQLNETLEEQVRARTRELLDKNEKLVAEIAERKRAQSELNATKEMFELLFQSSPDATLLVDHQGKIIRFNQQTLALFGYTADELLGKSIETMVPERLRGRHVHLRNSYYQKPVPRPMGQGLDLYAIRKDRSEFPVDIILSPVHLGEETQVMCVIHDLTFRKQMEAEVAELNRRLMDSLESERLHLAQELHDGPIQELYGLTYGVAGLAPQFAGQGAEEELHTLQSQINQIITMLRSMSQELRPPALAPFGLANAIREHTGQLAGSHPDLSIRLDLQDDGQSLPERVRMGLFRIYQVAITNVIRHARASQATIRLSLEDGRVLLEVADNGQGFVLPERWIEFARRGHLGLVGAFERAEAIGGKVDLTSAPGQGVRLTVTILQLSSE